MQKKTATLIQVALGGVISELEKLAAAPSTVTPTGAPSDPAVVKAVQNIQPGLNMAKKQLQTPFPGPKPAAPAATPAPVSPAAAQAFKNKA